MRLRLLIYDNMKQRPQSSEEGPLITYVWVHRDSTPKMGNNLGAIRTTQLLYLKTV